MKNRSTKAFWSFVVSVAFCVFICSCEATVNTGPQAGEGATIQPGTAGQDTFVDPSATAGSTTPVTTGNGGTEVTTGQTPGQPTGQPDAQVVTPPADQPTDPVDPGGPTQPQPMDGGTPDGNTGTTVTPPPPDDPVVTPPQPVGDGQTCLKPGDGTYTLAGAPYQVTRMDGVNLASVLPAGSATPTFSIWHPEPLEANCPHPIVAWGNGTGVTGPDVYDFFNRNGAAWGMVVIGSDYSNVGSGAYHRAGIDYLLQQNNDPGSKFYQKLSDRAGTSGHSQGGMGATAASSHPNVFAEVSVAGGGFVDAKVAIICLTGTEDFVAGPCMSSVNGAAGPGFIASWQGGDHVVTETLAGYIVGDPGSLAMQRLYAAWFRCFLADDPVACAMFKGNPCGICNEPGWAQIEGRNM